MIASGRVYQAATQIVAVASRQVAAATAQYAAITPPGGATVVVRLIGVPHTAQA
ncbi:MAG: hypothetical protein ACT4P6_16515 [Gemmatimonadaceae bacterium]